MKIIKIILIVSFIFGCQSQTPSRSGNVQRYSGMTYKDVENTACLRKHGYENKAYCECMANAKDEVIPVDVKNRVMSGDSSVSLEMLKMMIKNKDKLDSCDPMFAKPQVSNIDLSVPEFEVPPLAAKILRDHNNKILTPENRKSIKPILPIGYEFYMNNPGAKPYPGYITRLTKIENNAYYFTAINERNMRQNNKKIEYGVEYYLPLNDLSVTEYKVVTNAECVFVLNEACEYEGYTKKKRFQMLTVFKNGLWVSVQPLMFGEGRELVIRIFGIDGLPLYRYEKSLVKGYESEYVRVEPGESWLKYVK